MDKYTNNNQDLAGIQNLTKFDVFMQNHRYADPFVNGYALLFITKPSLFLHPIKSNGDTAGRLERLAYENMTKDHVFSQFIETEAMNANDKLIIKQLSFNKELLGVESNFMPIFTNRFKGFQTLDTTMSQAETYDTRHGYRMPLPTHKIESVGSNSINIPVMETANLDFVKMMTLWVNYISNIIPTTFLINMGIKYNIKRFVFTSSMATYGKNDTPFTEDMRPNPIDPYGIAKYACEMDLQVAYEQHGMEYCVILPHNVYGKYQNIWDPYRNVLGIWMYKATKGDPFTVYGDGEQTRAFSYIDDILPCLWTAAVSERAKNERINLGGKYGVSLNTAAALVAKVTGKNDIIHLEPRYEVKHAWSSYEKSEILLKFGRTNPTCRKPTMFCLVIFPQSLLITSKFR